MMGSPIGEKDGSGFEWDKLNVSATKRGRGKASSREELMLLDLDAKTADGTVSAEEQRKLRVSQLFNHLFRICNILRGPINQDEFKSYVIPILFLMRISDCYDEETAAAKAK